MSARSTDDLSPVETSTGRSSPRSTSSSIPRHATSSAPGPTMSSCAPALMPMTRNRPRCSRLTINSPRRSPTGRPDRSARRCRARPTRPARAPLGDIIADAQLAATSTEANGAAVIAFTNPGGIRTDIAKREQGAVTYADVFASQPFRNQLVTLTLTGMQIKNMLEQQWLDPKRPRVLQISNGFSYAWDNAKPYGDRIIADRMSLHGQRIDPATSYRVTVNNFLAVGGDGFTVLTEGVAQQFGVYDVDALYAHFQANSPLSPGPTDRIVR